MEVDERAAEVEVEMVLVHLIQDHDEVVGHDTLVLKVVDERQKCHHQVLHNCLMSVVHYLSADAHMDHLEDMVRMEERHTDLLLDRHMDSELVVVLVL